MSGRLFDEVWRNIIKVTIFLVVEAMLLARREKRYRLQPGTLPRSGRVELGLYEMNFYHYESNDMRIQLYFITARHFQPPSI